MSMKTTIYYGIGFNCDCKPKKFKEFIETDYSHRQACGVLTAKFSL